MADEDCSGRGNADNNPTRKALSVPKLKVDGVVDPAMSESLRKAMDDYERQMKPFRDLQDKLAPQMKAVTATQEAMEKSIGRSVTFRTA